MKNHRMRGLTAVLLLAAGGTLASTASAATLNDIYQVAEQLNQQARQSQARIDALTEETRELLNDYKTVLKEIEGLQVYNRQLERQIAARSARWRSSPRSIDDVTVIERQITPLMMRMIDGLDQFVSLDLPFLIGERDERIERLREMMDRADVTVSEKFSQILQAYQIENEYGRTMEAYDDTITIDGTPRKVDVLKVGRIALVYQSPDGEDTGFFNPNTRSGSARRCLHHADPQRYSHGASAAVRRHADAADHGSGGCRMTMTYLINKANAAWCLMALWLALSNVAWARKRQVRSDLQVTPANSLDELLRNVQERRVVESRLHTSAKPSSAAT
jgi:hypothetical protein